MDLPGNCKPKDKSARGANKIAYSPQLRGGIYRGEMYSSVYSQENIVLQNSTSITTNGVGRAGEPTPQPCRVLPERSFNTGNFNGYERLSLSSVADMT